MYNIKLVYAYDCLRSVHCQISVTISKPKVIFSPPPSFFPPFLPYWTCTFWTLYTMRIDHSHPHPPISSSTLPQNLSCLHGYVFWFDEISHGLLCDWLLPGPLFRGASADSHSCELVKGGVVASLENGFSQPFTPSYSSRILPASSSTMWA